MTYKLDSCDDIKTQMELSEVSSFYSQLENGKCHFVEKYGPRMGTKCNVESSSLFCEKHQEYGVDENKAFGFLQTLASNPEFLNGLLDSALFLSTHHLFEDCEDDECENCFSEDTKFSYREKLLNTIFEILDGISQYSVPLEPDGRAGQQRHPGHHDDHQPLQQLGPHCVHRAAHHLARRVSDPKPLQVVVHGNYYRDVNYDFIMQTVDGAVNLLTKETEDYLQRKLTDNERKKALSLGLFIV